MACVSGSTVAGLSIAAGAKILIDLTFSAPKTDTGSTPGTCVATGSLGTPRVFASSQLLSNGKVLVAGGIDTRASGQVLASAELYDPATGKFTPTGAMSTPRNAFALVALGNGGALVAGGFDQSGKALASAEVYDPTTGDWTPTAKPMSTARVRFSSVALSNGQILLAGGFSQIGAPNLTAANFGVNSVPSKSAESYDPISKAFALAGTMVLPRAGAGIARLPNGARS